MCDSFGPTARMRGNLLMDECVLSHKDREGYIVYLITLSSLLVFSEEWLEFKLWEGRKIETNSR